MALKDQKCVVCQVGAPTVTDEEILKFKADVPEWEVVEEDGMKKIRREFSFKDFREALYFVDRVGAEAEEQQHHPKLLLEWGKVGVWWWTHKIKGLHENDFVMAAKTDEVYRTMEE